MAQGETNATSAYFVLYGTFSVWILHPDAEYPNRVGECKRGEMAGEFAILGVDGGTRTATLKAATPECRAWKLERQDLLNVLGKFPTQKKLFDDLIAMRTGKNKAHAKV